MHMALPWAKPWPCWTLLIPSDIRLRNVINYGAFADKFLESQELACKIAMPEYDLAMKTPNRTREADAKLEILKENIAILGQISEHS
ncbi:hypothetical protein niasHT_012860 [Heterodera trifolii]|uniref:Uncharacterized protein n=1 Tax=Heterodera trifolii TaxID=157864 RepID=A0ABD2KZ58_9BILA